MNKNMTEKKIFPISSDLMQVYRRKFGMFGSSSLGNDLYFLKEIMDMAIPEIGEDKLVEELKNDESSNKKRNRDLGENWDKFQIKFKKFGVLLAEVKSTYDLIEKKSFSKITTEQERRFIRASMKIPLLTPEIYTLAVFINWHTPLHRMSIDSESWKIIERQYKIIGAIPPRRHTMPQVNPEIEVSREE